MLKLSLYKHCIDYYRRSNEKHIFLYSEILLSFNFIVGVFILKPKSSKF